jgi:hypothetical protein
MNHLEAKRRMLLPAMVLVHLNAYLSEWLNLILMLIPMKAFVDDVIRLRHSHSAWQVFVSFS